MRTWTSVLLIALCGMVTYGGSNLNFFFWGDEVLVVEKPLLRSLSSVPDLFTHGFWAGEGSYYRPLSILTYLINYQISELDPFWFHFTNMVIHILVSLTLYFLLRWHFREWASFWPALLFCLHPAICGTVFA